VRNSGWSSIENYAEERKLIRKGALDTVAVAQKAQENSFNRNHINPGFSSGWACLRLYRGYILPSNQKAKLAPQQVGPFRIIRSVGRRRAYELEFPQNFKIHLIISAIHLEPSPDPANDPWKRQKVVPPSVQTDDNQENDEYKIEKILRHRDIRRGRGRHPKRQSLV
jgi:hypothetical protein